MTYDQCINTIVTDSWSNYDMTPIASTTTSIANQVSIKNHLNEMCLQYEYNVGNLNSADCILWSYYTVIDSVGHNSKQCRVITCTCM